jgi:hypothetical protein
MYNGDSIASPPLNITGSSNNSTTSYNDSALGNQGTRETGIIEKLLVSIDHWLTEVSGGKLEGRDYLDGLGIGGRIVRN